MTITCLGCAFYEIIDGVGVCFKLESYLVFVEELYSIGSAGRAEEQ